MASFDPSIISQIPDYAGNPLEARAKAFKLADLIDEQKLHKLQLGQAQQDQENQGKIRDVLGKAKLDTPEDRMRVAGDIMRIDPAKGMQFMRETSQERLTELESKKVQLEFQAETVGPSAVGLLQTLKTQGLPAMAAQYQQQVPQINARLQEMGLKPLPPQFPVQDSAQAEQILQAQIGHSQQARQILAQQNKDRDEARADRRLDLSEKAAERSDKRLALAEQKQKQTGQWSDEEKDLLASLAEKNVNLPTGMRSKDQIHATLQGLLRRSQGKTSDQIADDIVSGKLSLTAETAGARIAGGQVGKVSLAANELDTFGDQVLTASKNLPRGAFGLDKSLTINGLIQKGEGEISDPRLLQLRLKLQALNNAYDQLSARGGTDVEKRGHIRALFDARLSEQAVDQLVKGVKEEAAGARAAARRTIAESSEVSGQQTLPGISGPAAAGGPTAPAGGPAAQAPTATGPNGQKLILRNGQWVPLGG